MNRLLALTILLAAICCVFSLKLDFSHEDPPHKDCVSHHGHAGHDHQGHFPRDKIEHLNKGEPVDANCPEYTQHLLCVWKEKGVMNEAGVLQKDVIISKVAKIVGDNAEDKKKTEDCIIEKATPGQSAIDFYNCVAPLIKKYNS